MYNLIKRLIVVGRTEGLAEKINVFYAFGKLTTEEYEELSKMLPVEAEEETAKEE